jgi:S-adenosylmethionine synthetase
MKMKLKWFFLIFILSSLTIANSTQMFLEPKSFEVGSYPKNICDLNVLNEVIKFDKESRGFVGYKSMPGSVFVTGELTSEHYFEVQQKVKETLRSINYDDIDLVRDEEYSTVTVINKKNNDQQILQLHFDSEEEDLSLGVKRCNELAKKLVKNIKFPIKDNKAPLIIKFFRGLPDKLEATVIHTQNDIVRKPTNDIESQVANQTVNHSNLKNCMVENLDFYVNGEKRFVIVDELGLSPQIIIDNYKSSIK